MGKADGDLFKDKIEVSLDGRQIFYLFFGGAVIASLVFVLGVMVGRRVESRAQATASIASPSQDPLAALDQLEVKPVDDLAFPAALRGGATNPLGVVDTALASLQADADGDEDDDAPTAEPKEPAPEPQEVIARPEPPAPDKEPEQAKPAPEKAPTPKRKEKKAPEPEPEAKSESATSPRFTLQLSSFQDRAEAEAFFQEMKNAGYSPYIVEAAVPDRGTWFRVRLGKYGTYGDAVAAKAEFEEAQRIIAYVTRLR